MLDGVDYWKNQRDVLSTYNGVTNESNEQLVGFHSLVSTNLSQVSKLMKQYISVLINTENEEEKSDCNASHIVMTDETKSFILECRYALRYVLSLFRQESQRSVIQHSIVCGLKLHIDLSIILSRSSIDAKCQNLAAKIFGNLGTCNEKTSFMILHDIKPSPSDGIKNNAHNHKIELYDSDDREKEPTPSILTSFENVQMISSLNASWSDMVYVTGSTANGRREAFSAVVASIYNCIVASSSHNNKDIQHDNHVISNESERCIGSFNLESYASNQILMCNLVRYILPKDTIQSYNSDNVNLETLTEVGNRDTSDEGTFWTSLLFELLFCKGFFPQIYKTLGFSYDVDSVSESDFLASITPEQIVLLNCFDNSLQSYNGEYNRNKSQSDGCTCNENPIGGDAGEEGIKNTVLCIGQGLMNLRKRLHFLNSVSDTLNKEERYPGEKDCVVHAIKVMTDILGTSLCMCDENDNNWYALTRLALGQQSSFLADTLIELGAIVDKLDVENRGVKARELVVSNDDQHFIVGLVRIIGNLCYKCKSNQDLVREASIPNQNVNASDQKDSNIDSTPIERNVRNGLHVVLSCTSFAVGCFTLREWGVVAIRNILDGNQANQDEVAKLEAQQVINTPELQKLGVKLDLDKGQVKVSQYSGNN